MVQSCKRYRTILIVIVGMLLLQSCLAAPVLLPDEQHTPQTSELTTTKNPVLHTSEAIIFTPTPIEISTSTVTPIVTMVVEPAVTPSAPTPITIEGQCLKITDDHSLAEGLVLLRFREEPEVLQVLGSGGLANPQLEEILPSQFFLPVLSPDGKWVLGRSPHSNQESQEINLEEPLGSLLIRIGKKDAKFFPIPDAAGYYWLKDKQFVIRLEPEGDRFTWVIVNPFEESEMTISVKLEGSSYGAYFRGNLPSLDPRLELVAQYCSYTELCEGVESVIVRDVNTGEEQWRSDTFDSLGYDSADWSPGGEYVVLYSVEGAKSFRIHKRSGELVHNVVMPEGYYAGGVWTPFSWSPDGRFIVGNHRFDSAQPELFYDSTFLYDIKNGSFIDLCLRLSPTSSYYWSSDGSRFAVKATNPENRNDHEIYIIDVLSKKSVMLFDSGNEYQLKGWTTISE